MIDDVSEAAWERWPRISYGKDGATFWKVCPHCSRFVKPDKKIRVSWGDGTPLREANALCSKHGRVEMPFAFWNDD